MPPPASEVTKQPPLPAAPLPQPALAHPAGAKILGFSPSKPAAASAPLGPGVLSFSHPDSSGGLLPGSRVTETQGFPTQPEPGQAKPGAPPRSPPRVAARGLSSGVQCSSFQSLLCGAVGFLGWTPICASLRDEPLCFLQTGAWMSQVSSRKNTVTGARRWPCQLGGTSGGRGRLDTAPGPPAAGVDPTCLPSAGQGLRLLGEAGVAGTDLKTGSMGAVQVARAPGGGVTRKIRCTGCSSTPLTALGAEGWEAPGPPGGWLQTLETAVPVSGRCPLQGQWGPTAPVPAGTRFSTPPAAWPGPQLCARPWSGTGGP